MGRDALTLNGTKPLRVCRHCNKKAYTEDELELFVKHPSSKHGRQQCCTDCYNKENSYEKVGRAKRFKKDYGISEQDYTEMLKSQNSRCKLCGKHESEFSRKLSVDHCHSTGKVRGLLCPVCNTGIGKLGDDPIMLLKAVEYLLTAEYVPINQGDNNENS